jgi:hypothetical protein
MTMVQPHGLGCLINARSQHQARTITGDNMFYRNHPVTIYQAAASAEFLCVDNGGLRVEVAK